MGLYKIDNVSSEEWQRRMLQKYNFRLWVSVIVLMLVMGAMAGGLIWVIGVMHP